ncbi:MAG: hypothetical protein J6J67_09390 [Treponema sp.]|nr:hypothetical protein [Treponema sp.]
MKKKIKLFLSSVVFICGIFTSCENLLSVKEEKQTEQSYIRISTNLSSVDRSVLPSDSFKENTTGLTWTLSGSHNGTAEITIKVWNDEGDTAATTQTAYQKMINDSFIPVDEGTWIFTLTAKNNSGKVLEATITQTITGGQNILVFDMKEATGENVASGQIEFTLNFPENVIKNVIATLTSREDENFLVETDFTAETGVTETFLSEVKFSYHGNDNEALSAGNYILKLELQQQTGLEPEYKSPIYKTINTYTCLIHVAPGLCSKGEAELKTLAPLYKVTFEEGIEFEESIVSLSYNEYTTFALPTIKEEEGYEYQWYKNGFDFYANSYYQESIDDPSNVSITEDTTFGVKCYKIVDEKDIVRTPKGDSTGESFSIGTAEGLAIFRDLVNGCNENLKMVDNSGKSEDGYVYYETGSSRSQLNATLTSDIDLTQLKDAGGYELSWVPINGYTGTFDGGGYTITVNNTYQVNGNRYYQGFFDTLDGATIKNLVVAGEETISESGLDYCGGIAGFAGDSSSIKTTEFINCVNKRKLTVSGNVGHIGGFLGYFQKNDNNSLTFENCINLGEIYVSDVSTEPYVAGFTTGATSYTKCINAGNVTGATYLDNSDGAASGTVAGFDASVPASFTDCINLGDISANSYTADDEKNHSTDKVYGFSSIENNKPSFTNCIDAGSAKYPFTGVGDDITVTYNSCYYNSDSYGSNYNTDGLSCMSSNDLCIQEKTKFSNWYYDSSNSRYPLPDIVKSETTEGVSSEIWQEVVAKAIPKVSNFTMLQERIASASGTADNPDVIVLNGTINIAETLEITTPIKIIASTSAGVTITRGADDSGKVFTGAFFDNQSTLTLEGITLDGGKDLQIQATAPLITSSRSLTLNNCTLQNNKNTSTTPGGAINISAGTFTMNGGVIGEVITEGTDTTKQSWEDAATDSDFSNYAYAGGGGIYVASGDVTIDNATISYNYTLDEDKNNIAHGGGIYIASGNLTLEDTEVSYNRGYQGAGVKCYSEAANAGTVTLKHATIKGNVGNVSSWSNFGGGVVIKNFTLNCDTSTEASIIEENYSGDGGALFLENTTSTLQNITIRNNIYPSEGYNNGSEVLVFANANVSIGSSDVTIKSADGETRGIFMNNNNTLNLSGDAKLDTPIYLTNGAKVTVSAALTSTDTVATITPEYYPGDTYESDNGTITVGDVYVLTVGTGVTLSNDIVERFAVTPKINAEDKTEKPYTINLSGMLQLGE